MHDLTMHMNPLIYEAVLPPQERIVPHFHSLLYPSSPSVYLRYSKSQFRGRQETLPLRTTWYNSEIVSYATIYLYETIYDTEGCNSNPPIRHTDTIPASLDGQMELCFSFFDSLSFSLLSYFSSRMDEKLKFLEHRSTHSHTHFLGANTSSAQWGLFGYQKKAVGFCHFIFLSRLNC